MGICIILAIGGGIIGRAAVNAETARLAADDGRWTEAAASSHLATEADPLQLYRAQRALARAMSGDMAGAIDDYREVVRHDALPHHRLALAQLELEAGDPAAALQDARLAFNLAIADPTLYANVWRIATRAGDDALAQAALGRLAAAAPTTLPSDFWSSPEVVKLRARAIDDAVGLSSPSTAVLVLAFAGERDRALRAVDQAPEGERALLAALVDAGAGEHAAGIQRLRDLAAADPLDFRAPGWLAFLLRQDGAHAEADRYAAWSMLAQADAAPSILGLPTRIGPDLPGGQFQLQGDYPYPVYQRRGTLRLLPAGSLFVVP